MPPPPSPLILLVVIPIITVRSPLFAELVSAYTSKQRAADSTQTRKEQIADHGSSSGTEEGRHATALALRLRPFGVVMMMMVVLLFTAATAAAPAVAST